MGVTQGTWYRLEGEDAGSRVSGSTGAVGLRVGRMRDVPGHGGARIFSSAAMDYGSCDGGQDGTGLPGWI
jgi:hypothetical protein